MKILHIDSSSNSKTSLSRTLSKKMVAELLAKFPDAEVTYRDVSATPLPFVDDSWLENGGHELTKKITQELIDADVLVFAVPVYNFSVPASFKAWIDQAAVNGTTYAYTAEGPKGLLPEGKKLFVISTSGSPYSDLTKYGMNHHEPYLRTVFGFLGLDQNDISVMPYSARSAEQAQAVIAQADTEMKEAVAKL
jgi:FMN-dependent NADH-azoreductase